MVWSYPIVLWLSKNDSAGHSARQKKNWWEDNIKEWTRMDFASSARPVDDRTMWKGVVVRSSVVPQRPCKIMG